MCKHIWKGFLHMMGMFELMICGLDLPLQDNSFWKTMFISGECSLCLESMWGRVGLGTHFSLSLYLSGAPRRSTLRLAADVLL